MGRVSQSSTPHEPAGSDSRKSRRWTLWLLLLLIVALTVALVAIPVFVIMPFKAQTQAGLSWSFRLRRLSTWATAIATLAALALSLKLWRDARWWSRLALPVLLATLLAVSWFSRQNYFEWIFNPLPSPAYARVGEAGFIADNEMVLAVDLGGDAVAFPVQQMAYHHVVNVIVGGKPITATY
ncbi:MAG: DUF3179 domain-containing protein [Blastocatellia bacterium]|nr:DUF3179 domain-containing protein [Blastocatellia bacterium]